MCSRRGTLEEEGSCHNTVLFVGIWRHRGGERKSLTKNVSTVKPATYCTYVEVREWKIFGAFYFLYSSFRRLKISQGLLCVTSTPSKYSTQLRRLGQPTVNALRRPMYTHYSILPMKSWPNLKEKRNPVISKRGRITAKFKESILCIRIYSNRFQWSDVLFLAAYE